MIITVHFSKLRQLLVDFQLIPTPSLDFQVALNLGETVPLMLRTVLSGNSNVISVLELNAILGIYLLFTTLKAFCWTYQFSDNV